jgi:pimeloyl-ACP methyl ester carboxylesterase
MRSYLADRRAHDDASRSAAGQRATDRRSTRLLAAIFAVLSMSYLPSLARAAEPATTIDISAPPGRLVDIGTHRLYLYCTGHGSPTVVLDAGLGGSSLEWLAVQQTLAAHTRVCAYDRAGYGWSDAGVGPRTSLQNAVELHTLLQRARIKPPYVLAGHSFGGYDVQLFASLYPESVAGLALVDSSHGRQVERFEAAPIGVSTAPRLGSAILMSRPMVPEGLPAELAATVTTLMSSHKALFAATDELQHFRISARQVAQSAPWPDVPVVVLTRGERVWPTDEKGQLMETLWMRLQSELATRNPRTLHVVVRHSGHHIHLEQPKVVARAVGILLEERRAMASSDTASAPGKTEFSGLFAAHTLVDDALISDLYTSRAAR